MTATTLRTSFLAWVFTSCALTHGGSGVIDVAAPTGDQERDRASIVSALAQAEPGDTLRFAAGTYVVGPIVRLATPALTLLGHTDGTTLRGGDFDPAAGYDQFGEDDDAADALGVLHLFEGGTTVRNLTFADSWFGLILGGHYDEEQPERAGGFVIEGNTFQSSQNGVRATNIGDTATVIRSNTFIDVHYGVSALGNAFVVEGNTFEMRATPRTQGYGEAVSLAAEHVAGGCSDNRVLGNTMSGQELGVGMYTGGSRTGTGNQIRDNRIVVRRETATSTGVELRTRADRDGNARPIGGLIGTVVEGNLVTDAARAGVWIGAGCDDSRVTDNTFADLTGPAIVLGGNRSHVAGHAPDAEIRHVTTAEPGDAPLFPVRQADATDLDFERLAWLSAQVGRWADRGEIVGCELLVIRDGMTLLHDVYGWSDREEERPLRRGSIYRVRSMTKPFVGTAALQLVADGKLELDDRVSKHLPEFANDRAREITVRQLLTHTAGLSAYFEDLFESEERQDAIGSLREAVAEVAREGVTRTPGEYHYSDLGSGTLAAVVAEVAGMPVEDVIAQRTLLPLALRDTHTAYRIDVPWRTRMNSTYVWKPERANFERYWDPSRPQEVRYFEGSGGIYSTTHDYARFAWAWLNGGALGDTRILPRELVVEALEPHAGRNPLFSYGYQWDVSESRANGLPRRFGHGGSDGTIISIFPETRTLVLYFTQSRSRAMRAEFGALLADTLPEAGFIREVIPGVVREWVEACRAPAMIESAALVGRAGHYRQRGGQEIVEIQVVDGALVLRDLPDGDRLTLIPSLPTVFHSAEARVEFDLVGEAEAASDLRITRPRGDGQEFIRVR